MKKYSLEDIQKMSTQERARLKEKIENAFCLLRSDEWKVYIGWIENRAEILQEDVNKAVEEGDIVAAKVALGVLKDSRRQAALFSTVTRSISDDLIKTSE